MSKNISDDKSKANPFAASTRIKSKTASTLSGQIRHDLRRGPQPKYVDENRSHLNRILIENTPIQKMRVICSERRKLRETKRGIKSNAAIATSGIITFGSEAARVFEALSIKDQDRAFKLLTRLIARRLATSVHGLTVHLDEATIHAHYQLAAVNKFGDPISKSTRPRVMSELQDLTAIVMKRLCPEIERGRKYGERIENGADVADTIHKSVRELHRTLPVDLAAKRAILADLDDGVVAAQVRVDEMQGRVTKLESDVDLTDKKVKRLKTYRGRLHDRLDELKKAQSASEDAKVEADRLADLSRTEVKEAEVAKNAAHLLAQKERQQLGIDRAELNAEYLDKTEELAAIEVEIVDRVTTLNRITSIIRQAVSYLSGGMGHEKTENMMEAVDEIEATLNDLTAPKATSDPLDEVGPGM